MNTIAQYQHGFGRLTAAFAALALSAAAMGQQTTTAGGTDTELRNQIIRQALAAAAPVRTSVEQFYLHHKAFPASNADVGMNLPQTYRNYDVQAIAVGANGIIDIALTPSSGVDGGTIRLTPSLASTIGVPTFQWACRSPSYTTIADASGGSCEYTNQP